jgi:hypothetical protein
VVGTADPFAALAALAAAISDLSGAPISLLMMSATRQMMSTSHVGTSQ